MSVHSQISAIRVSDEAFLVSSMIDRCPKTMMIRELIVNAIEAASKSIGSVGRIEIRPVFINNVSKLSIWNTGPGMSSEELHHICDLAASLGKSKSLDENFGMGAKVSSLPSNRVGLRYRSCKNGIVSEVILCERGGVYGRLKRSVDGASLDEVIDVTDACLNDGCDLSYDWTEVVLFGNRPDQDTVKNPYDGNPTVTGQWLADYLYHRLFRIDDNVQIKFLAGTHKLGEGSRQFRTIPDRAFSVGRHEAVSHPSGIVVHYFFDPPRPGSSHNASVSGAITSDVSICSIVYKNEMYDLRKGRQWTLDSPIFGITYGARHISVHIELPSDFHVRPEAYRQFLRYVDGEQGQVEVQHFSDIVIQLRPTWLVDLINSFAPHDAGAANEIRDELQDLLNSLRVKSTSPRLDSHGDMSVELGGGNGARHVRDGSSGGSGEGSRLTIDELLALPSGSRRATIARNAERAPEIIPLYDQSQIDEKGIKGRVARFYQESNQLFVNMRYTSIEEMSITLELEYAASPDPEAMRRIARELAEKAILLKVGRVLIFAIAKQLNSEWSVEDVIRAYSPESLSVAADDFSDLLQNARRKMGQTLRIGGAG